ncbi:carbamoyltransferase C-terminal domain-containing protein [Haloarcula sp. H-GB4]|uniref:carbamoyltransferase family protein n=1 Tax=Haloarcula sp. H-GB4 TaxID=3069755 RepID=UPI0027B49BFC|nr:carbamoyltransferase C-terminal domain-containing protein [Haloarcula sp. H-GB4]MDQ2072297.1 carbamoyltransferase C-terminal domain-containing protein [Haloarcula sp. H-GB4]
MSEYVLSINPCVGNLGSHDPSAVLFKNGQLAFGVEEERLTREKHAENTFPMNAIEACLEYADISLSNVKKVLIPWKPRLFYKMLRHDINTVVTETEGVAEAITQLEGTVKRDVGPTVYSKWAVRNNLSEFGEYTPPIETIEHHRCHAASAFHPSGFNEALIVTMDGRGEYDCTVVWKGNSEGLKRLRTYEYPNSLGFFFGAVTKFLGYYPNNGEGKIMGLAPYGDRNDEIEQILREEIKTGLEYDVSTLSKGNFEYATRKLEEIFDRPRKQTTDEFSQWERDLAHVTQKLVEETVTEIVTHYSERLDVDKVGLAGGVALNCKVNKEVMELPCVESTFVQPVSNDAGAAVGAGLLDAGITATEDISTVYWGPEYTTESIEAVLQTNKLSYAKPDDLCRTVAEHIADGKLVGWFQGQLEMGPRALGNRSILADPRSEASLDRVNEFVKHREGWRPFAPSMLKEAGDQYLVNFEEAPFMIKTFDVVEEKKAEIPAVLHPADDTTRPQTVREDQNPRYYGLISAFEEITGVPVVLNTSFNDNGEPIVNQPIEAIKDFYGMGLDIIVLEDILMEKT